VALKGWAMMAQNHNPPKLKRKPRNQTKSKLCGEARGRGQAARQIAEETGESPDAVRMKINRGREKVEQLVQQSQPPETKEETLKSNEIKRAKEGKNYERRKE